MNKQTHILRRAQRSAPLPGNPAMADALQHCFASVPRGAEEIAAGELISLGIDSAVAGKGGVAFTSGREGIYRANLWLRTASRVLIRLAEFPCITQEELYQGVRTIRWNQILRPDMTLAVDCSLRDSDMKHSGFVALKTKDAVVDVLREQYGRRPDVNTEDPDVRINVHLAKNLCTVSLDSSAVPLDRRGYRRERNDAPLRESLAAAMVLLTGWDGSTPLVDPMCGSGTIPIEAALIATNTPPGLSRTFGFQRWLDFDGKLWDSLLDEAEQGISEMPPGIISGCDYDGKALEMAQRNGEKAGLGGRIRFLQQRFAEFSPPDGAKGTLIINPPYGKRLGDVETLTGLYRQIGDIMKQRCRGWTGYILTGNLDLAKQVGLKASRRFVLFNGPIECRLLKYDLY